MISDGEVTNIKVADLKKLCNFVVDNFFIWSHLSNENYILLFTLKFDFFQMTSEGEMTKTKVVDLQKL
jgi:hypothetical protein